MTPQRKRKRPLVLETPASEESSSSSSSVTSRTSGGTSPVTPKGVALEATMSWLEGTSGQEGCGDVCKSEVSEDTTRVVYCMTHLLYLPPREHPAPQAPLDPPPLLLPGEVYQLEAVEFWQLFELLLDLTHLLILRCTPAVSPLLLLPPPAAALSAIHRPQGGGEGQAVSRQRARHRREMRTFCEWRFGVYTRAACREKLTIDNIILLSVCQCRLLTHNIKRTCWF